MAPLSRSKDSYNIGRNHAPTYVPVEVMNECSKVSSSQRAIPELGVNHAEVGYSPNGINEKTTNVGVSLQNSPQTIPSGGNVPIEPIPPSLNPEADNEVFQLVHQLLNPVTRERALSELSKKRETYEDIALVLWYSFGAIAVLLQEIISVYPMLQPPSLTNSASNRICNALALFQSVASHRETREHFFNAHIPLFLYPFLNTTSKTKSFEYLRLTSLGVVGALVKSNSPKTIRFLLSTEIIPLCLRTMETGLELSKTVAIFIVQKIILDDTGLNYICQTYERFYAVGTALSNMVNQLVNQQSVRLLKHVIRCYLRLSENIRAREALRQCLPQPLRDSTFARALKDDPHTRRCLNTLLMNLSDTTK